MLDALKTLKLWQILVLVVVALGVAGGVYGIYSWATSPDTSSLPANTQLVAAEYGNLVNTVSASGSLVFPTRAQPTFGSAGTVEEVSAKDGETVKKGQVLAKLDSASLVSLQKTVAQARVNLRDAQDNLEKAQSPYTDSDIAQAEAAVTAAKVAIKTAQDNLEKAQSPYTDSDIAQAEAAVTAARVAIKTAQDNLEKAQSPYAESDIAQAEAAVTTARVAIKAAQENLEKAQNPYTDSDIAQAEAAVTAAWVAIKAAQDNLENAQNPYTESDIAQAEAAVTTAKVAIKTAQDNLEKAQNPYTESDIAQAEAAVTSARVAVKTAQDSLEKARSPYTDSDIAQAEAAVTAAKVAVKTAKDNWWTALMKAEVDPENLVKALDLEQKQTQLAVAQTNLARAEETLAEMKAGADPLDVQQKQTQLAVAQVGLAKAQADLASMKTGPDPLDIEQKQKQVAVAQASLARAEETLAEMKAGPDLLEVALKQLDATSAQAALDDTLKKLEMSTVVAPFEGIVASVNIEAGQSVNASTVAIELVDLSVIEVSAILGEFDVSQVKEGQKVVVSLDALPDLELSGEVSTMSVVGRTQSGVVSYPVTIRITPPSGVQLREGMSATASIVVQEVSNVLLIPNQAIGGSINNPSVKVMVNGQPQEITVRLGASDDLWTEVSEGLQEGDVVVVEATTAVTTQQRLQGGFQTFQGGGFPGGGGMGPIIQENR